MPPPESQPPCADSPPSLPLCKLQQHSGDQAPLPMLGSVAPVPESLLSLSPEPTPSIGTIQVGQIIYDIMEVFVEVARAPGVNRRRSAHKTATHISVDLVIVLFRVDVTCHTSQCLLYINSVHRLYNRQALDQLLLSSQLVPSI